jgi:hypothetical protein
MDLKVLAPSPCFVHPKRGDSLELYLISTAPLNRWIQRDLSMNQRGFFVLNSYV